MIISEIRKKIARIGAIDIKRLENDPDLLLVWRDIKSKAAPLLKRGGKNISEIKECFQSFYIDMWREIPWEIDPVRNSGSLVIRLWSLLFNSTYMLCGALVHEANHWRYLKAHKMLGKPEHEQEEFHKLHERTMEIQANREQLGFHRKAGKHIPEKIPIIPGLSQSKKEIIEKCKYYLENWKNNKNFSSNYSKEISEETKNWYNRIARECLEIEFSLNDGLFKRNQGIKIQF